MGGRRVGGEFGPFKTPGNVFFGPQSAQKRPFLAQNCHSIFPDCNSFKLVKRIFFRINSQSLEALRVYFYMILSMTMLWSFAISLGIIFGGRKYRSQIIMGNIFVKEQKGLFHGYHFLPSHVPILYPSEMFGNLEFASLQHR